ncbi:hypothetical protein FD755_020815 [Muntiacus reevesi]|uniref:Uncharacterized protein n=1 Tax=Muntiacus reevesi TaxID=9886 RepID=A0A5N3X0V9_MUNRE|nr:hypothetical protein FD755_020815 [Muntiacus reevesi]
MGLCQSFSDAGNVIDATGSVRISQMVLHGHGQAGRDPDWHTKSIRAPRDVRKKWLRVAVLGSCTALAACLFWGSLGGDDGITEVLAHRSEILPGRFIEVPCSEDYDSHRRLLSPSTKGHCCDAHNLWTPPSLTFLASRS